MAYAITFACVGLIVLDIVLCYQWKPAYFRRGILVYSRRIILKNPNDVLAFEENLKERFNGGWLISDLVFKQLSKAEIAFREKLVGLVIFNYMPIMHGHIEIVPHERAIVVTGRVNLIMYSFLILLFYSYIEMRADGNPEAFFMATVYLIVLAGCYYIQAKRFNNVSKYLSEYYNGKIK